MSEPDRADLAAPDVSEVGPGLQVAVPAWPGADRAARRARRLALAVRVPELGLSFWGSWAARVKSSVSLIERESSREKRGGPWAPGSRWGGPSGQRAPCIAPRPPLTCGLPSRWTASTGTAAAPARRPSASRARWSFTTAGQVSAPRLAPGHLAGELDLSKRAARGFHTQPRFFHFPPLLLLPSSQYLF